MKNQKLIWAVIITVISICGFIGISLNSRVEANGEVNSGIKVDYIIRINKIDSETKELLSGAKFNLLDKDGNVLRTSSTSGDGVLDFGMITTYGEGEDVYYIEEASTPEGYIIVERSKIKVIVRKTIVDEASGAYDVNVVCEVLDYNVDTTRYEYTPIYNSEQLKKIGSGETVVIDGVKYKYMPNSNYKLMADIDLGQDVDEQGKIIPWTPIDVPFTGILNGNNHKISNLQITETETSTIKGLGMFRYVDGIIENLELENVVISAKDLSDDATGITEYSGVGAFAGVMKQGTIRNCKVSGGITTTMENMGGFVGHTLPGYIVKFQNCTNNATVVGNPGEHISKSGNKTTFKPSNIGGLVGCALGAISVSDSTNNGQLVCYNYNVGGLVGYVESKDYQEVNIKADFDETEKVINLVVENVRITGKYELQIETRDAKTLGIIDGGIYTILDKNRKPIPGCEKVQLINGKLKVATIDINNLGIDTYYIIENKTIPGYKELNGNIKLEVKRYWDIKTESYKVSVKTEKLSDDEYVEDKPTESKDEIPSQTGSIFSKVNFENVSFNSNKAEFIGCTNNGQIISMYMNAGGIVGTSHCYTKFDNCTNKGDVQATGYGKAGGIIAELHAWNLNNFIEINNCSNSGQIVSQGSTGSAGGILAHAITNIKINNCENTGKIISGMYSAAAGILADGVGIINIDSCKNEGEILATSAGSYSDVNCIGAGILAKSIVTGYAVNDISVQMKDDHIKITNCSNTGDIKSTCHTGGIISSTNADDIEISNCKVSDCSINDVFAGDKGGIAGYLNTSKILIKDCEVDNVDLDRLSGINGNTYGSTSGILGNICYYGPQSSKNVESVVIENCTVKNSNMKTQGKEASGILGMTHGSGSNTNIRINNCIVDNCDICNRYFSSTYSSSGGIVGGLYNVGTIIVENSKVNKTSVASDKPQKYANDCDVGGIIGVTANINQIIIDKNDVIDCIITNNTVEKDYCANAGGILGFQGNPISSGDSYSVISNCNVINTNVTTTAGNASLCLGGSYGKANLSNVNINGGTVSSKPITSSNSVNAGLVAFCYKDVSAVNCTVDNINVQLLPPDTNSGTNAAGILGMTLSNATLENCDVKNSEIYSTGRYGSGTYSSATVGGVAGTVGGYAIVTDCDVNNTKITSTRGANAAGILACTYNSGSSSSYKNCTVTNSDITLLSTTVLARGNSVAAGLLANSNGQVTNVENCKVENTNITGNGAITAGIVANSDFVIVKGSSVKDVNIKDKSEEFDGYTLKASGGIVARAQNASIEDVKVENTNFDVRGNSVGGVIGSVTNLKRLKDCIVDNIEINEMMTPMIDGTPTVKGYLSATGCGVAGLVGDIYASGSEEFINNKVINSRINTDVNVIGGLFGMTNCEDITIKDSEVNNVKINGINENSTITIGSAGGVVGNNAGTLNIDNVNVKNSSVIINGTDSQMRNVGGIIGFTTDASITNSNVENTKVSNNTQGSTGGLVGMTKKTHDTKPIESEVKVISSNVLGESSVDGSHHTGGIIGFGRLNLTDSKVENTTITGNGENCDVGGIIGNALPTSVLKNSDVKNAVITALGNVDGIAGYEDCLITNCNVIDSKVGVKEKNEDEISNSEVEGQSMMENGQNAVNIGNDENETSDEKTEIKENGKETENEISDENADKTTNHNVDNKQNESKSDNTTTKSEIDSNENEINTGNNKNEANITNKENETNVDDKTNENETSENETKSNRENNEINEGNVQSSNQEINNINSDENMEVK